MERAEGRHESYGDKKERDEESAVLDFILLLIAQVVQHEHS
jgi:hypothetical protein